MKSGSGFVGDLSSEQETALEQFKTQVTHYHLDPYRYDDNSLLRFLRARKFNLPKTLEMFDKYMKWREDFGTNEVLSYQFPEVYRMKIFYPHGYHKIDKLGRPIYIERLGKMNLQSLFEITTEERMLKYYVREYERLLLDIFPACTRAFGTRIEQTLTILDLSGVSLKLVNNQVFNFIKIASTTAQDYYPEILGRMFIVNAPMLFSMIWNTVKSFVDEKTRQKISICGSNFKKELFEIVDPSNLPDFLGGTCKCPLGCVAQNVGPWNEDGHPLDDTGAVIWPNSTNHLKEESKREEKKEESRLVESPIKIDDIESDEESEAGKSLIDEYDFNFGAPDLRPEDEQEINLICQLKVNSLPNQAFEIKRHATAKN